MCYCLKHKNKESYDAYVYVFSVVLLSHTGQRKKKTYCANTYCKDSHSSLLCTVPAWNWWSSVQFSPSWQNVIRQAWPVGSYDLCTFAVDLGVCTLSLQPPRALISTHFASWRKVTGKFAAIMLKITRPPCDYEMSDQRTSGTCAGLRLFFFPCSTLGMEYWNVAWEEDDYTYWEII